MKINAIVSKELLLQDLKKQFKSGICKWSFTDCLCKL